MILGVVQHRGKDHMIGKEWSKKGYVTESEVIRLAEQAGFKLFAAGLRVLVQMATY